MKISSSTFQRIAKGIRKVESLELDVDPVEISGEKPQEVFVKVTGTKSGIYYPGVFSYRRADYPSVSQDKFYDVTTPCYVEGINGEPLTTDTRYFGRITSIKINDLGQAYPVVTVVYTPTVKYYGYDQGDDTPIWSVSWTSQDGNTAAGCTLTALFTTYFLSTTVDGNAIIVEAPAPEENIQLGPFPVVGNITIPGQSGTVSGTVGECTLSGTVTIPEQTVDILNITVCGVGP